MSYHFDKTIEEIKKGRELMGNLIDKFKTPENEKFFSELAEKHKRMHSFDMRM